MFQSHPSLPKNLNNIVPTAANLEGKLDDLYNKMDIMEIQLSAILKKVNGTDLADVEIKISAIFEKVSIIEERILKADFFENRALEQRLSEIFDLLKNRPTYRPERKCIMDVQIPSENWLENAGIQEDDPSLEIQESPKIWKKNETEVPGGDPFIEFEL